MDAQMPEKSLLDRMHEIVERGQRQLNETEFRSGLGRIWTSQARALLGQLYGTDAPQVDFWCPPYVSYTSAERLKDDLHERLEAFERLVEMFDVPAATAKIFIGHGRSTEWFKLRDFLSIRLGLACDEFNTEPMAGLQTVPRIEQMLRSARMAFLIMTAEDKHADDSLHARENVIHEIGLFQARLGAPRAIVLLEEGCKRFSNLDGLTTINFPRTDIMARSEEIRSVLSRERILR